jgi:ATP sulfurylase
MGAFKEPHGGELKDLYLDADAAEVEKAAARDYASWDLTERQLCDIELLLNGAFSPLDGFLNKDDYETVVGGMRLTSGVLWPIPITLGRPARSRRRNSRHPRSRRHLDAGQGGRSKRRVRYDRRKAPGGTFPQ